MQITRSTIDTLQGPADCFTGDVCIDAMAAEPHAILRTELVIRESVAPLTAGRPAPGLAP
jgi:hypothetical protein